MRGVSPSVGRVGGRCYLRSAIRGSLRCFGFLFVVQLDNLGKVDRVGCCINKNDNHLGDYISLLVSLLRVDYKKKTK